MSINTFSLTALFSMVLIGAAVSAPLPADFDGPAFIHSHNARAQFLPGSYIISPGATDDGRSTKGSEQRQDEPTNNALLVNRIVVVSRPEMNDAFVSPFSHPAPPNTSDVDAAGLQGGNAGLLFRGTRSDGADGGFAEHSPTHVGAVPLPPTLPLFGAAVLGLATFGRSRKRRAAKL